MEMLSSLISCLWEVRRMPWLKIISIIYTILHARSTFKWTHKKSALEVPRIFMFYIATISLPVSHVPKKIRFCLSNWLMGVLYRHYHIISCITRIKTPCSRRATALIHSLHFLPLDPFSLKTLMSFHSWKPRAKFTPTNCCVPLLFMGIAHQGACSNMHNTIFAPANKFLSSMQNLFRRYYFCWD